MTRYLPVFLVFISLTVGAQSYQAKVLNRAVFWSEVNLVYQTGSRWSFQLDHQYRRQADDNGRDRNVFRHLLLQVFRPWISYQLSEPVRLSLSPVGLWWNWGRVSGYQPTTFFQELRVIPQVQIIKPVEDGESQQVLANRFNVRLRAMARWINPMFKRTKEDDRWYSHLSIEPMAVLSASGAQLDQNRTYVALGRKIRKQIRLEPGYLNQFTVQRAEAAQTRLFRFNHALHLYVYLENGRPSKARPDSGPED